MSRLFTRTLSTFEVVMTVLRMLEVKLHPLMHFSVSYLPQNPLFGAKLDRARFSCDWSLRDSCTDSLLMIVISGGSSP
jgi:hypothetical protein